MPKSGIGTQGHFLAGISQPMTGGGFQVQGFASLNQLEEMRLVRPSDLARRPASEFSNDPTIHRSKLIRDQIQRPFDSPREKNAISLRDYLERTEVWGELGNVPAITLWVKHAIVQDDGAVLIPYGTAIMPPDGETQTEARFMLRDRYPETGDRLFKVTVYVHASPDYPRTILCDYNDNGVRVNKKMVRATDPRGAMYRIINKTCASVGLDPDVSINRFDVGNRKKLAGREQLMAGLIGANSGNGEPWDQVFVRVNKTGLQSEDQCIAIVALVLDAVAAGDAAAVHLRRADPLWWQAVAGMIRVGRDLGSLNLHVIPNGKTTLKARYPTTRRFSPAQKLATFVELL